MVAARCSSDRNGCRAVPDCSDVRMGTDETAGAAEDRRFRHGDGVHTDEGTGHSPPAGDAPPRMKPWASSAGLKI